jgi:thioredoxin reductase (NADPH)
MANKIGDYMGKHGTKFSHKATPSKLETLNGPDGRITVTYQHEGEEKTDEYDTVLFAMGRYVLTANIGLDKAGVVAEQNGKFKVTDTE